MFFKEKFSLKMLFNKTNEFSKKHWFLDNVILSFVTVFVTEIFARASFTEALFFMILSFPTALMNILIVLTFLMIPFAFKKSFYWKYFICLFWIALSIISCVVYSFRMMPFNFTDILLIPSTFTVFFVYLSVWQMILIGGVIIAVIYALVILYRKASLYKAKVRMSLVMFVLMLCVSFGYYFISVSTGIIDNRVQGLQNKYDYNGFVYCFTSSTFDTGMREPADYSASEVADIVKDINKSGTDKVNKANIIFLQLESFFDVNKIKDISYSENPVPVFSELLNNYSHGVLNVPTFSAGTANTEFEIITGMNTDFFGIGEYPYQTVAEDSVIESVAFSLGDSGYTTHAVHNNSATFYDRNIIYSNLGFDTFTSLEYMYNMRYNSLGWAKDMGLVPAIFDCLGSSEGKDFIYTVGVQTHGTYPDEEDTHSGDISVSGAKNERVKNKLEYYVNELKEVDAFLGALISVLELYDEPVVLVVFGDHMPGVDVDDPIFENYNKYRTEYVLWSNFDMDIVIKDLESYQLHSYVLDRLNISGGSMSKLHQKYSFRENPEYMSAYELLQYDMLYGERIGEIGKKYEATKIKMGIKNIKVDKVNLVAENIYIHGQNFNEFSKIYINDDKVETEFINSENLVVSEQTIEKGDKLTVSQLDKNGRVLSSANVIEY